MTGALLSRPTWTQNPQLAPTHCLLLFINGLERALFVSNRLARTCFGQSRSDWVAVLDRTLRVTRRTLHVTRSTGIFSLLLAIPLLCFAVSEFLPVVVYFWRAHITRSNTCRAIAQNIFQFRCETNVRLTFTFTKCLPLQRCHRSEGFSCNP